MSVFVKPNVFGNWRRWIDGDGDEYFGGIYVERERDGRDWRFSDNESSDNEHGIWDGEDKRFGWDFLRNWTIESDDDEWGEEEEDEELDGDKSFVVVFDFKGRPREK